MADQHPSAEAARGSDDPEYARNLKRATLAASVGSALEYYDFALYSLASALIFGEIFFPALGASAGTVASLATLAIGFVARPVGGLFFGALGDRLGRKWVLMLTIALMGGSSTLIGVLPTGEQVGALAPILLVVLRIAQGFGAGAEQAGATTLMAEYSPVRRRGFYSALPFVGIMLGTLLASAVFVGLGQVPDDALLGWVWRIPFLASIFLIGVAVLIRLRLKESPTFVTLEKRDQVSQKPFRELLQSSRPTVWRGIGLRMAENGGSYIYQTLSITYVSALGVQKSVGPLAVAIGAVIGFFVIPFAGSLSDRFGRMRVYRVGAVIQLVLAAVAWPLLSLGNPVLTVVVIAIAYGVGVNVMLGAQCAALPELFGSRHRYIGVAVSREFSAIIAGGIAPFVGALLLSWFNNSWVPLAAYVIILTLITLYATLRTPETRARDLTLLTNADGDSESEIAARPEPLAQSYRNDAAAVVGR
ncbi:MFS transporter [Mycolicibacterium smegmatis]|uniref:Major facilitator superfamily MFS_1 n=2 Tax=Mycolicibacterium smegmatis (strain ATCC 700084 / mc(2)155) TaxID=246196 RepID=I7FE84_MYCS2|nr:MFS transporter [Mycolicibacterium smegmatis]ABK74933.1 inner membrane metabolite transport protein YdfJ [Mycolicibacterium smegmatis MC2 155]AFP39805.1 Major facilitator superfamily MFS_1 [Mycolicibacterium smegmatis MC2 155]AIU08562.1 MFS transporter [Mycolicibacterium smegmatis MC2 155]AIU15187.1 MFS transporter [Mycolicibacterium smegmatis]AIU21810.1 MFS transporter [Mycolicibacterium smegmatis]